MNTTESQLALSLNITIMYASRLITATAVLCLLSIATSGGAAAHTSETSLQPSVGPGKVVVHTALGGFILGYDIDQNGTEGILSEARALPDGKNNVAVETFDQTTGKIIKIVTKQTDSNNDFVTLGVVGKSVGLVEFEHTSGGFVDKRVYPVLNPLKSNTFTARWTPPLTKNDIIQAVSESQGAPNSAVLAFQNGGSNSTFVFGSNVAANSFGPLITVTDPVFSSSNSPVMALDSKTNEAVLASSFGCPNCPPTIGLVDLTTGTQSTFPGLGFGFVNGIAVDSETGIACTTTEIDFSVEFYDLAKGTGFIVPIPGATSQAQSGQDVEFDPIHKLFLVGQEFSSTAPRGSSIQVFDEQGNFIESINGLSLPASPALIALHPNQRSGYVIVTPNLTSLQSFTY